MLHFFLFYQKTMFERLCKCYDLFISPENFLSLQSGWRSSVERAGAGYSQPSYPETELILNPTMYLELPEQIGHGRNNM